MKQVKVSNDINEIRSLAQIFTPASFKRAIQEDNYYSILYRLKKYTEFDENTTNLEALSAIYDKLFREYRNEYVFKNVILKKLLLDKYSLRKNVALSEFAINKSKADVVLLNGKACVYEIKSDLDKLDKLHKQINDYFKFTDLVILVTTRKFSEELLQRYKDSCVGIIELNERGNLKTIKEAESYSDEIDHDVLFKTLRKEEYLKLIEEYYGFRPDVPNTQIFRECLEMAKNIEIILFHSLVIKVLKQRNISNPDRLLDDSTPVALKHICYSINLSNKGYSKLQDFLNQKSKECTSHI